MGSGEPDKVLDKSVFSRSDYLLLTNELGVENCFFADLNLVCVALSTLSTALNLVLVRHGLKYFETSNNIDHQV